MDATTVANRCWPKSPAISAAAVSPSRTPKQDWLAAAPMAPKNAAQGDSPAATCASVYANSPTKSACMSTMTSADFVLSMRVAGDADTARRRRYSVK